MHTRSIGVTHRDPMALSLDAIHMGATIGNVDFNLMS